MPGIGPEEAEAKRTVATEAPLDTAVEPIARQNDFQATTTEQAEAGVREGGAVDQHDVDAAKFVQQSGTLRDGVMINDAQAAFQMEATLTANKLFDQQPPSTLNVGDNMSSSAMINDFIMHSTFTPVIRDLVDRQDTTLGRMRNHTADRTSEMHVRELSGGVFE